MPTDQIQRLELARMRRDVGQGDRVARKLAVVYFTVTITMTFTAVRKPAYEH